MNMFILPSRLPTRSVLYNSHRIFHKKRTFFCIKSNNGNISTSNLKNNGSCHVDDAAFRQTVEWVESYGGYVNPSLGPGYSATTGSRGIIAESEILEKELEDGPVIAIPDSLQIKPKAAQMRLDPLVKVDGLPSLKLLEPEIQTSLLLAFERNKGKASFWDSYIQTLPSSPSCAWLLPENELRLEVAFLPQVTVKGEDWLKKTEIFLQEMKDEVEHIAERYGDVLEIDAEDLLWALGHVHSRAYGRECALTPIVDLINHAKCGLPPLGFTAEEDDVPMTYVGSFVYGIPQPLSPGEELFVSYSFPEIISSFELFLHFGFVPIERREEQQTQDSPIAIL